MNKNFLIISSIDWNENWQMHHQLATSLEQNGYNVLFVENTGVRTPNILDAKRIISKLNNWFKSTSGFTKISKYLSLYSPIIIPFPFYKIPIFLNSLLITYHIKKFYKFNNVRNFTIITFLPTPLSLKIINNLNPDFCIYYCANNMSKGLGGSKYIISNEIELLKKSDSVFSISTNISNFVKNYNDHVHFFPPGVNFEKFNIAYKNDNFISKLKNFTKPIIGYVGSISKVFDLILIIKIAQKFQNCSIVIVGKKYININSLLEYKNVFFVDQISHVKLPNYIKYFKVGLIPYIVNEFTHSVNTCKLNEYLALGVPVVSTNIKEINIFNSNNNNIIYSSSNHKDFLFNIEQIIDNKIDIDNKLLIEVAKNNSWDIRFNEIIKIINNLKPKIIAETDWQQRFSSGSIFLRNKIILYLSFIVIIYSSIFHSPLFPYIGSKLIVSDKLINAQAIIVFSGNGEDGYTNTSYQKRAKDALIIYNRGLSNKIILTSGRLQSISEGKLIESYLYNMGLKKESLILLDKYPSSTYENVLIVNSFLKDNNIDNIILLTSPYHTFRALKTWEKVAPNINIKIGKSFENPQTIIRWNINIKEIKIIIYEILAIIHNKFKNRI